MKGYLKIRKEALYVLRSQLPDEVFYHGVQHTLDVLAVCNKYIKRERISPYEAKLLRLAVLLHDIGFTVSNVDHENQSMKIAEALMSKHGFPKKDIDAVKGLILATRLPQNPQNHLEKILCDADLDYLGRDDYYAKSRSLLKELNAQSNRIPRKEWNEAQIAFLTEHEYHTDFARKYRQPKKEKRIQELKALDRSKN